MNQSLTNLEGSPLPRRSFNAALMGELLRGPTLALIVRRAGTIVLTLLVIAYLTIFGLTMAERGRAGLPAPIIATAGEALQATGDYLINHPATYFDEGANQPALAYVATRLGRSTGLLLISMAIASLLGVPLGILVAMRRGGRSGALVLLVSVLGVSTPSFLLAMLFWVVNIWMHRTFDLELPATGFGWDSHLVMPALVLAARPLAQIVQITYVTLNEVLGQDYIRTARAKGLSHLVVMARHALSNIWIPVLTTLGMSLRLSLASLPVVEFFFLWPGVGSLLLEAIERGDRSLATDMVVGLGLFFLLVNLLLEALYPRLDPRLRDGDGGQAGLALGRQPGRLQALRELLGSWWADIRRSLPGARVAPLAPLPAVAGSEPTQVVAAPVKRRRLSREVRPYITNLALIVGLALVLGFVALGVQGETLAGVNPYETHGLMKIDGELQTPPFRPSSTFPWGTDLMGRDLRALVLAGARQTLTLAFFATVARVLVGAFLGAMAGWWQGSRFDRLILGAIGVWAAYPVTLFAMILILALGIQQGMNVFVIAFCVVGWGEIAQFVRGQVISIKPKLHIEAARAVGLRTDQLLSQHVLPGVLPSLLVLAVLEMGGVLMLLAELGFLNIFMGGGFRVQLAETGAMVSVFYHFSDVPEWGALLANIRQWWRSYPWLAWYPGLFFFLAILAFNLCGEGLRRLLDEAPVNIGRLFNRYAFFGMAGLIVGLNMALQGTTPLGVYSQHARTFESERAMAHVRALASPEMGGRASGTPGGDQAATYIADQMAEIGLLPAGQNDTYIQTNGCPRFHLAETPALALLDGEGNPTEEFTYREDFAEYVNGSAFSSGTAEGAVVGLAIGRQPGEEIDPKLLGDLDLYDRVILMPDEQIPLLSGRSTQGILAVTDDPNKLTRRYLMPNVGFPYNRIRPLPIMYISPEIADALLAPSGGSLAALRAATAQMMPGEVGMTKDGARVRFSVTGKPEDLAEKCHNVIGFIPGEGAEMGLDSQVIMVSAYYDGLGTDPAGKLYPGANDNASGVAAMLEMARAMKSGGYSPDKTIVFVAWAGAERSESLSIENVMSAKIGFSQLRVEAVIELSGLGGGSGEAMVVGQGTSFRLNRLFQSAADRLGVPLTTRGRTPHFDRMARAAFGGRSAMTGEVSWDGSDEFAHTTQDTIETIDPVALEQVGETTFLVVTILSREVDY